MEYYRESTEQVCSAMHSGEKGLSRVKAIAAQKKYGKNVLQKEKPESLFQRFLHQMADPMIIVLLSAAGVSGLSAACAGESPADVIIILIVVLMNAILGVFQENKAEKAIEALQSMTRAHSKVLRDERLCVLPSEELVPGDVVLLEAGDAVPADGRILKAVMLKAEESALTGESIPADKNTEALRQKVPLAERACMLYMGSTISYGKGEMLVTATGMQTEMGKIAGVLGSTVQGKTPLQQKLAALSKVLSWMVLGICAFIFVFSLWREGSPDMDTVLSCFLVAVSLAVAAVPEGLAAVVTIVLSMGVTKMSRQGAVIRRMTAVETLGCAQVICSDKTGTLTQNRMTVQQIYGEKQELLKAFILCNDARLLQDGAAQGEATEKALVVYGAKQGVMQNILAAQLPRVGEIPFDALRKRMSTFHKSKNKGVIQYTKGAPDLLLDCCDTILENGQKRPLTPEKRRLILAQNKKMADAALRVLAAACKTYPALPPVLKSSTQEKEMTFLGLAGLIDPVRPEAKAAIAQCKKAGIQPVMITGDHKDTAAAIGQELGILQNASQVITGHELDGLSQQELCRKIREYCVYARVQPQHKARIVNAWQNNGKVVAMAGDGVNDAPALKTADIGVGMGISGTDVTKNVADMVLSDDNFSTIVTAVKEGRRIYDNIRKAVQFLLASNLSEVISIFAATMAGITLLQPVQLLWINLITDCFPALALGMEKPADNLMERPPRTKSEGIFAKGLGLDVLWQGLLVSVLTIFAYFAGLYREQGCLSLAQSETGAAMAFLTMSMAELFHSFNMRSRRQSIFGLPSENIWLWLALLGGTSLTLAVMLWPAAAAAFGLPQLLPQEYLLACGIAFLIIPLVEMEKAMQRKIKQ